MIFKYGAKVAKIIGLNDGKAFLCRANASKLIAD
jgi:hypothetical protein